MRADPESDAEPAEEPGRERGLTYFLLAESAEVGERVRLSAGEAHHALDVLRLEPGAVVPATDGCGRRYRLRLLGGGPGAEVDVISRADEAAVRPRVELGLGVGRKERWLWCVEKLTELGVARVTPLLSGTVQGRRTFAGAAGRRLAEKARSRAVAALKQSRGTHLPEIATPAEAAEWMARPFGGLSLLLALPAPGRLAFAAALLARLRAEPALARAALRVAVGPEGGFLEDEERAFGRAGFTPAHLGERRLRFETAAVAALCHVRALWALEGEAWTS